ncbi:hypothetical protein M885DRAFT_587354 [Pelagophyceae sp. CCMP2097]|nr:hypothetical protein M885DRAFT_587354 [Pelagophyceae sp. CCMP2097]
MLSTPLVGRDFSEARCVADVCHALDSLEATMEMLFERIVCRAEAERFRVSAINVRVGRCEAKVLAIGGMKNRATTVMSTSRYPDTSSRDAGDVSAILADGGAGDDTDAHRQDSATDGIWFGANSPRSQHARDSALANPDLAAATNELWSRLDARAGFLVRPEMAMEDQGLSKPSCSTTNSVGALLLFNSDRNPYRAQSKPFAFEAEDEMFLVPKAAELCDAPESILKGLDLPEIAQLDYQYKPGLADVLKLDLPLNLPLPDIADVNFVAALNLPAIAPSAHQSPHVALPQILPATPDAPIAPPPAAPPPPPPPRVAAPPPPPPRRPPPPAPRVADVSVAPQAAAPRAAPSAAGDLMSAIKGFSVDALRRKEEDDQARANAAETGAPLSMLDEMRKRMARRQSAISGRADHSAEDDKPAPRRAPPPPRPGARPPPPAPLERRGSLFDADNATLNKMLAPPPWRHDAGEDEDDWDHDDD